jgi:hypothetical protein
MCFMPVTDPKTVKNRVHLDLTSSAAEALFWRTAGPLVADGEPSAVLLAGMTVCAADGNRTWFPPQLPGRSYRESGPDPGARLGPGRPHRAGSAGRDGWPDQPGTEQERAGRRQAHGHPSSHLCLLERKYQVEAAIYATEEPT